MGDKLGSEKVGPVLGALDGVCVDGDKLGICVDGDEVGKDVGERDGDCVVGYTEGV